MSERINDPDKISGEAGLTRVLPVEEMKELKRTWGYTNEYVAERSGVPLGTVQKVFGGTTGAPRRKTLEALSKAFDRDFSAAWRDGTRRDPGSGNLVREESAAYRLPEKADLENFREKKQGQYTLEDYFAIPDERRVEMIDGVFYDMDSPTSVHQLICGQVYARLLAFISSQKGSCIPFTAPMDVRLDCDDRTIVEPDVMVVCDRGKITGPRIVGAPDFIMEVISPSSRRRDQYIKLAKYENAGVKEYWIVDPDKRTVAAWIFPEDSPIHLYTFSDRIPVWIFGGECEIDFSEIDDYISFVP